MGMKRGRAFMKIKRVMSLVICTVMSLGVLVYQGEVPKQAQAAKKLALSSKKLTINEGESKTIKLNNNKKAVKWTVTSGKSNIVLSKKTKKSVKITAKKVGKAKIQAKVGSQKIVCTVTITSKSTNNPDNMGSPTSYSKADVDALKAFIADQNKKGAKMPTDIKDTNYYMWNWQGNLSRLKIDNLGLTGEIDFSAFKQLQVIQCYCNDITSVNVSKNLELTDLECGNCLIKKLDVSKNTKLRSIDFPSTDISNINVSKNTKLLHLNCQRTKISKLDVSKNTNLEYLYCDGTSISSLDVSKNTKLETLDCSYTEIKKLDVTKNINLRQLVCNSIKISSLDLSQNKKLEFLSLLQCENLQVVDVSNNKNLETVQVGHGPTQIIR